MLCITADERELLLYVVFERKRVHVERFPDGIFVRAQDKGWMMDVLVQDWFTSIQEKRPRKSLGNVLYLS